MFQLKWNKYAVPGKPLKRKSIENQSQKYEEHRPEKKLNAKWQEGRPWLTFDTVENTMTCSLCVSYYGNASGNEHVRAQNSNLKGQNRFLTGCSNRKISAVIDHE